MKLEDAPNTCSLSPHIVASEAGIPLDLERVDIFKSPHLTDAGTDYSKVNPNAYVPALVLDDGTVLTEGAAIVQYLCDLLPEAGLMPEGGSVERNRAQAGQNFVATERHKSFSPWLLHPEVGIEAQALARKNVAGRLERIALDWNREAIPRAPWERVNPLGQTKKSMFSQPEHALGAFMDRVAARPKVREAIEAEGMKLAA